MTYDKNRSELDDKSNNGKNNDATGDNSKIKDYIITLEINESLQQQQIVTAFVVNKKGCIIASLNHVYHEKTIVSNIYQDWIKTIDAFARRAKEKGISDEHIIMLTDALDDNNEKVMQCLYDQIKEEENNGSTSSDKNAVAIELVKDKIIDLFLDEVI
ncbi:MAG: hypothetical protein WBZ36_10140 [Candidatus Nitrosopolaris sp.]